MSNTVFCCKLQEELEALARPPFPGALGEKLHLNVSKKAWDMWLAHQTMLINEYRLNLVEPKSRDFLKEEMQKYFFGEGSQTPSGYNEPK